MFRFERGGRHRYPADRPREFCGHSVFSTMRNALRKCSCETVRFTDGSSDTFDAILFGTGYEHSLTFLSEDIRRTLDADADHLDLYKFTFHPDLPGVAFLGQFDLVGPYFPVLELQARWIAYTLSGALSAPSDEDLAAGLAAYRARRGEPQAMPSHTAAML